MIEAIDLNQYKSVVKVCWKCRCQLDIRLCINVVHLLLVLWCDPLSRVYCQSKLSDDVQNLLLNEQNEQLVNRESPKTSNSTTSAVQCFRWVASESGQKLNRDSLIQCLIRAIRVRTNLSINWPAIARHDVNSLCNIVIIRMITRYLLLKVKALNLTQALCSDFVFSFFCLVFFV